MLPFIWRVSRRSLRRKDMRRLHLSEDKNSLRPPPPNLLSGCHGSDKGGERGSSRDCKWESTPRCISVFFLPLLSIFPHLPLLPKAPNSPTVFWTIWLRFICLSGQLSGWLVSPFVWWTFLLFFPEFNIGPLFPFSFLSSSLHKSSLRVPQLQPTRAAWLVISQQKNRERYIDIYR